MIRLLYHVNIPRFFLSHRLALASAAREAGYEVHVATAAGDEDSIRQISARGFDFHALPLAQHGVNPLQEAHTLQQIIALYHQLQPGLVHHVSIKPVLYGGIAARLADVPAVVHAFSGLGRLFTLDDARTRSLRAIVRPLLRTSLANPRAMTILQNDDDRQRLTATGLLPADHAVLIRGSGVDMTRFVATPERGGQPIVLYAGRLIRAKGVQAFVDAAEHLRGRARFVIVGYPEPTSPDVIDIATVQQWADAGIVEWWGRRDDMPGIFAQAHIVCLPSQYGEGVPRVLIEAAACARAIVSSDIPGCRDVVCDGISGLLVAPGDGPALVHALLTLLNDPNLRQRMGAAGRTHVEHAYSQDTVIEQTLALYASLLAQAG